MSVKPKNKEKRKAFHLQQKKARESAKRDERLRRKRDEDRNPRLRQDRLARNVPVTIDKKRVWDEVASGDEDGAFGLSVDVQQLKRPKLQPSESAEKDASQGDSDTPEDDLAEEDEVDSMLGDEDEEDANHNSKMPRSASAAAAEEPATKAPSARASSPSGSTASTKLDLTPEALMSRFPTLFNHSEEPKVLITTSINGTLHAEASLLTTLFPHSNYIRRSAHRYAYKFSVREISRFAANRGYTKVLVLEEDQKRPSGLIVVNLPSGPTFHFSISNWVEGAKLPGHGNPTNHYPELILNNFRTPLGLLTAHLFRSLFPPRPELAGRQVVTLHNQRDYIFLRRHRYVFRDKRPTEKSVVGTDGKPVKGVEDIRAGLQELCPRFTLKLRRIDRGIQRASGQEWEWRPRLEKARTRFQL